MAASYLYLPKSMSFGNRRLGHRGDLDQVEVGLGGEAKGHLDADDADLFSVRADQPHLGNPDAVVDARLADVVSPSSW